MAGIPAGKTSSVKALDRTFILQTEFKLTPKQAVVTSVTLDGQVIHKVERSFPHPIDSEEDYRAAETAIMAQHESIAKKIIANGADFIRQTKSIKISRLDRLGIIPGISYVANIASKLEGETPPLVYHQSKLIMEIADAVSSSSRVGPLKVAAIISDQGNYILDRIEGEGHLVTLKDETDIGKILKEIENG